MSSAKVGDPRKAASCAGVGHGGEQGRERGGEEGQGICAKRDQMKGVWMVGRGGFVLRCSKHNVEYFLEHFPRVQTNTGKTNIFL